MIECVLYRRADGRWAWQLIANGDIVATNGSRGYASEDEARAMADRVIGGAYKGAQARVVSHVSQHLRASGDD